jgi:hypothetical protein
LEWGNNEKQTFSKFGDSWILFIEKSVLYECFKYGSGSQPGVHVPLEVYEKVTGGTQNWKKCSKEALLGRIFDLGVRKGHIILIWGYAEGYNFDLGVRGYQKVENPCYKGNHKSIL